MKSNSLGEKGFSLIEVLLAISLFSIIIITLLPVCTSHLLVYNKLDNELLMQHNTRFAMKYIEKEIRKCNQKSTIYIPQDRTIMSTNYSGEKTWVDLSGNKRNEPNTLIYFNKGTMELRLNKNKEHNILCSDIKDIIVTEIVEGELLQIEIIANKINYSVTRIIKIANRQTSGGNE